MLTMRSDLPIKRPCFRCAWWHPYIYTTQPEEQDINFCVDFTLVFIVRIPDAELIMYNPATWR